MWWIPFLFKISMTAMEGVKNQIFKKVNLPTKPTGRSCFFLFHSHNLKPKQNHQIASSRMKTRSTRSQTCMNYRGNIICFREIHMWTHVTWKYLTKNVLMRLIFQTLSSISPKFYVVCLQPYAWLYSYDRYNSFGTMIWGSLIVSPVLWLLSSRNTLSVSHSDTATGHHKEIYPLAICFNL